MVERGNIAVFGGGPGGLSAARELARGNQRQIDLIIPDVPHPLRSVYTTEMWIDADLSETFFPPEVRRTLPFMRFITPQGTDFFISTAGNDYYMVHQADSVAIVESQLAKQPNIHINRLPLRQCQEVRVLEDRQKAIVYLEGNESSYDYIVDATGLDATISCQLDVARSRERFLTEYVYGGIYRGNLKRQEMILVIGVEGGTCWVCPSSFGDDYVDVVFSAWGPKDLFSDFLKTADLRLTALARFVREKPGIVIEEKPEDLFSGMIRSHPTRIPTTLRTYAVGQASGVGKPLTGDTLQRTIQQGRMLTEVIDHEASPSDFHEQYRSLWPGDRLYFAGALTRLRDQENDRLGGVADMVGRLFQSSHKPSVLEREIEQFAVGNRLSRNLLCRVLTDSNISRAYARTILKLLELMIREPKLPDQLPLPSIT